MIVRASAVVGLILCLAVASSAVLLAQDKTVPPPVSGSTRAPIVCSGDLIPTSFNCGEGLGPYMTPQGAIGNPDQYIYLRGTCTPGDMVQIDSYRTSADADPAIHACDGDLCGTDNAGWGGFTCPAGSTLLSSGDDELFPDPCGYGGSFADPTMSFVCPPSGVFTLAAYDFIGGGANPEFEVHASGVVNPAPTLGTAGVVILALVLLSGGWLVLSRRRTAV